MGLIRAAISAVGGTMADQWKEFFICESLDADVLAVKGQKRIGSRSANKKGSDNLITSGNCSGRRTVCFDRGAGKDCRSMCGTGRVYL